MVLLSFSKLSHQINIKLGHSLIRKSWSNTPLSDAWFYWLIFILPQSYHTIWLPVIPILFSYLISTFMFLLYFQLVLHCVIINISACLVTFCSLTFSGENYIDLFYFLLTTNLFSLDTLYKPTFWISSIVFDSLMTKSWWCTLFIIDNNNDASKCTS